MGKQLIEGKRETMFRVDPTTLTIIGVDTDDGPDHPLYDERIKLGIDEAMVANIMHLGVREPIVAVVQGKDDSRRTVVVDGRQRVMHAREANKRLKARGEPLIEVPVVAEKNMDEIEQLELGVSLNEIRKDDPVMVKARKAAKMKAQGASFAQIANAFGVETATIGLWVNINSLCKAVKSAIEDGRITPTAAGALAGLTPDEQKEALDKLLADAANGEKPTVVRVKAHVKAKTKKAPDVTPVPQRRVLRRVVQNGEEVLSKDFLAGVRFAIGELNPRTIAGLTDLMKKPARSA